MTHPLLEAQWGSRYQTSLKNLIEAWDATCERAHNPSRYDIQDLAHKFMHDNKTRHLVVNFAYHIKNDMDETDIQEMLISQATDCKAPH